MILCSANLTILAAVIVTHFLRRELHAANFMPVKFCNNDILASDINTVHHHHHREFVPITLNFQL